MPGGVRQLLTGEMSARHVPREQTCLGGRQAASGQGREVKVAGSPGFVKAADRGVAGGLAQGFGVPLRRVGDIQHRGHEAVDGVFRFGFGRFDHDRLGNDEGKVHGRSMEPTVQERFGNVKSMDSVPGLPAG